jgi:transposase
VPLFPGKLQQKSCDNSHLFKSEDFKKIFRAPTCYRYRSGIPWRDVPERFGDWKNTHRRWSRWSIRGIWKKVCKYLAADADNEYGMIDSTIVRAHQHSAGAIKKTKARIKPSEKAKED